MILNEIVQQLQASSHPVAKSLHHGENCKVLCIGFKKGMLMKEHKTNLPATLYVFEGEVVYKEGEKIQVLKKNEEVKIPVEKPHSVEALENSLCLLIQADEN